MKKILVQFDGSNFYNKVKRIDRDTHLTKFDYMALVKSITKTIPNKVVYYTGEIRQFEGNKKSESLYAGQQKLFTHLRNQNIEIKLGYLLMSDGKFHEWNILLHGMWELQSSAPINKPYKAGSSISDSSTKDW